jgi:Asp-tRNA(Asn)/Glu-tRNA(Gln) amidotransferase A subunit family amidase
MTTDDLCFLSGAEAARRIAAETLSPVALMEAMLGRIDAMQPVLNAFTVIRAEDAIAEAKEAEAAVKGGDDLGPLHGVPYTVKDMINVAGMRITFGSPMFEHNVPETDTVVIERLKQAGAILLGITNMAECGHKGTNGNPVWGLTRNPWDLETTPGGSSGGAAAALASGCGALALGTDRAGSVRIPAGATGVCGLKPTLGVFPCPENPDLFDTTTVIGPMARSIDDIALLMSVCGGPDARDPWSHGAKEHDYTPDARTTGDMTGVRIAWAPTIGNAALDHETRAVCEQAIATFRDLGADVSEIEIDLSKSVDILYAMTGALAHAAFADKMPEFGERIDKSLRMGIEWGAKVTGSELETALFDRAAMFRVIEAVFAGHDLLVTPSLTRPAIAADHFAWDPVEINGETYQSPRYDWYPYTHPFNHTGHPALALPAGWTASNMPVGLQIVAPWHSEDRLIRAGAELEAARPWSHRRPPVFG